MFTLPETAAADLLGYIGDLVTDGWVIIAIAIGIPIGFAVIRFFVGLVRSRAK